MVEEDEVANETTVQKVGMETCRSALALDAWRTAQEVAALLGHDPKKDDGAVVMARANLHDLVKCKLAEKRERERTSPSQGGRCPTEFRLLERGADVEIRGEPGKKASARSSEGDCYLGSRGKHAVPLLDTKAEKTCKEKRADWAKATQQDITVTLCGDALTKVVVPRRVSLKTLRGLAATAEFFARKAGVSDDVPFLPLSVE